MNKKQCLYCGEDFKGERGLNLHFKSCAKNRNYSILSILYEKIIISSRITTYNFKFQ